MHRKTLPYMAMLLWTIHCEKLLEKRKRRKRGGETDTMPIFLIDADLSKIDFLNTVLSAKR
jgi:hypothetical protein